MAGSFLGKLFKAPEPQDFTDVLSLKKTGKPNEAIILPMGAPTLDEPGQMAVLPGKLYALSVAALLERGIQALQNQGDCTVTSKDDANGRATLCLRTKIMRYPDIIYLHAMAVIDGTPRSTLGAYSHSVYGHSDLGANKARLTALVDNLKADEIE